MNDTAEQLWAAFLASDSDEAATASGASYSAWPFGIGSEMADELVELVLSGRKRATAGALWSYEHEGEPVPAPGDYSVILDGAGRARCVIRTTHVEIVPFREVDEAFASAEGEGDLSLQYWREGHWRFFSQELAGFGRSPEPDMPVVCERFGVVFREPDTAAG
jgi:uncharacterized protein YhfF